MNDQEIHTVLERISDQAQPEEIDLWPAIAPQVSRPEPRRRRRSWRLAHVLGALLLLLSLSAFAYLALQVDVDPGLEGERAVALVTPLEQAQTRGETTVTLEWAYADANRLVLAYTVAGPATAPAPRPQGPVTLFAEGGRRLPALMLVHKATPAPGVRQQTLSFDTRALALLDGEQEETFRAEIKADGGAPFTFTFALPIRPAQLAGAPQTATAAGITMRLADFRVTDSMTTLELCYDRPAGDALWVPQLRLFFDGERVGAAAGSGYFAPGLQERAGEFCYGGGWFLPVDARPEQVRLEVTALSTPTHWSYENMETLAEVWAEHGVETEIRDGGAAYTLSYPEGFPEGMTAATREAILEEGRARMEHVEGGDRIEGPWVFILP